MKRHLFALAMLAFVPMAICSTAAFAQDHDQNWHDDNHDRGQDHRDDHGHQNDHGDRGDHGDHHHNGRHEGWDRHYGRGDRLPDRYRGPEYYVDDYRRYDLREPPRGYRWIRGDNGEFVLVAVATGIILQEILSGH